MKKWQTFWLYLAVIYGTAHLIRDVLQDLGINSLISTILVKPAGYRLPFPWRSWTTYAIELSEITLALYCLIKRDFGKAGWITIIIAVVSLIFWAIYWFVL